MHYELYSTERERERPSEASTSIEGTLGGMSIRRNRQIANAKAMTRSGHQNAMDFDVLEESEMSRDEEYLRIAGG